MTTSGVTIRNNHPVDPNSPTVEITRGSGKNSSTDRLAPQQSAPQQSAPLGEGDMAIKVVYPNKEGEDAPAADEAGAK